MLILELRAHVLAHLSEGAFQSRIFFEDGELVGEVEITDYEMTGPIVGDVFHNARSALDLMAVELAVLNGHSGKNVNFPFAFDLSGLEQSITKKNFDRCGEDAVGLLMQLRPYRGGNVLLRALHDLNIIDKHVATLSTKKQFATEMLIQLKDGAVDLSQSNIVVDIPSVRFAFPDDGPFAGAEMFQTLEDLVQLSESIVDKFMTLVAARH